jgi:hypothetical protein
MQNLLVEHGTELKPLLLSIFTGGDHFAKYFNALPLSSTAIQKLLVGHDTELRLLEPSISDGDDHVVPS